MEGGGVILLSPKEVKTLCVHTHKGLPKQSVSQVFQKDMQHPTTDVSFLIIFREIYPCYFS